MTRRKKHSLTLRQGAFGFNGGTGIVLGGGGGATPKTVDTTAVTVDNTNVKVDRA